MAIQTARLERLAVLLDNYQPLPGGPEFDLKQWGETKFETRGHLWWKQQHECGTAACAVGLACLSKAFEPDGLRSIKYPDGILLPVFGDKDNWEAVQEFFGLSKKQAFHLFLDDSYEVSRGPLAAAHVSGRIRAMIQRSEKSRRNKRQPRTTAAVEKIKAAALEPVG